MAFLDIPVPPQVGVGEDIQEDQEPVNCETRIWQRRLLVVYAQNVLVLKILTVSFMDLLNSSNISPI